MELNKDLKNNAEQEEKDVLAEAGKRLDDDEINEVAGGVMRGFKCKTCEKWFAHASEYNNHILETGHQA